MSLEENMDKVLARRAEIEDKLASGTPMSPDELTKLSRELADVRPVAEQILKVRGLTQAIEDAKAIIAEGDTDTDMIEMAELEIEELTSQIPDEEHALKLLLLPKDADDARNAILEVRAGTGGDEAALFAGDLFGMYQRMAARYGWRFEVLEVSETGIGGYKEAQQQFLGKMCLQD